MNSKLIILFNSDIIFYITDFLDDKSSFRLFNTNKYYHTIISKYPSRYTIKKYVEDYNPKLSLLIKYKIINYEHTENISIPHTVKNMIFGNLFNKRTDAQKWIQKITFGLTDFQEFIKSKSAQKAAYQVKNINDGDDLQVREHVHEKFLLN